MSGHGHDPISGLAATGVIGIIVFVALCLAGLGPVLLVMAIFRWGPFRRPVEERR